MSPNKERLEFSRKDTVYGSHTIPLYTAPPKREWVGLTDEELHLKSAAYANKRKEAYLNHLKKGLAKKLSKDMIDWIWVAHYEGYRDAMSGEKYGY